MMEISNKKRCILCQVLDCLIQIKEIEIKKIKQRTEEDYSAAIMLEQFSNIPFSLEKEKESDILEVMCEIKELKKMRQEINSLKNHLLLVPTFIKLHLSSE